MTDILKAKLEELAGKQSVGDKDDFEAYSYSGGNVDDAYEMGMRDGEIYLARELLALFIENDYHASTQGSSKFS